MEATAAWVEDEVYDGVDDNVQYLKDSPITERKRSMDKFGGLFHYGVWIFFRYLTERFPAENGGMPKMVLQVWKGADSSKGAEEGPVLDPGDRQGPASKKPYISIDKAFALFSDANRRASKHYEEGTPTRRTTTRTPRSTARRCLKKGQSKTFTATLNHLGGATYQFTPRAAASKFKLCDLDLAPKSPGHPGGRDDVQEERQGQDEVRRDQRQRQGLVQGARSPKTRSPPSR